MALELRVALVLCYATDAGWGTMGARTGQTGPEDKSTLLFGAAQLQIGG